MKVHKPKLLPEFHGLPTPRVVYVVKMVTGDRCNCNDADEAIDLLQSQCAAYVKIMQQFANMEKK